MWLTYMSHFRGAKTFLTSSTTVLKISTPLGGAKKVSTAYYYASKGPHAPIFYPMGGGG